MPMAGILVILATGVAGIMVHGLRVAIVVGVLIPVPVMGPPVDLALAPVVLWLAVCLDFYLLMPMSMAA